MRLREWRELEGRGSLGLLGDDAAAAAAAAGRAGRCRASGSRSETAVIARAVAAAAQSYGQRIAVVPAGEKWPDGSLRPAFEDLVGAGAILSYLEGRLSPEARAAVAVFQSAQAQLESLIQNCCSGRELRERDFDPDVALAAALNVSDRVPTLIKGVYTDQKPPHS